MKNIFTGTGVALITPFNNNLSIDYDALEGLLNHVISGGVDYVVVLGTTGETSTLSKDEKLEVIDFCKQKVAGRVPIVIGAGGNNTLDVVSFIESVDLKGVGGILSVAPYYSKPSQRGIFEHFSKIAECTTLPIILYNVPGRTSSNISATTVVDLATSHKNIVAIKEASGDFLQLMEIINCKPDSFVVLSGDDALTLPMVSLGAKGVISVVANSHPQQFSSLVNAALNEDFSKANGHQYKLINYINALFEEGNPSGIKAALSIMGICKNVVRLPLCPIDKELYGKIQDLITRIN